MGHRRYRRRLQSGVFRSTTTCTSGLKADLLREQWQCRGPRLDRHSAADLPLLLGDGPHQAVRRLRALVSDILEGKGLVKSRRVMHTPHRRRPDRPPSVGDEGEAQTP